MVPRKSKGIIMYLAMFGLLIVLLFAMMSMDQPVSNLKYYQVLDYFRNGEVEEYQIDYNDGTLTLKLEGQDQLVDYQLASITQFNQDIQPYIDQYEQTNDTTFKRNYLPAQETSLLVSLLPTLLLLGGMILVVLVAALTDMAVRMAVESIPGIGIDYKALIMPVVLVWYIFTELGSIAENAAHMGADVPDGLLKLLAAGKKAAERQTKDDEE